MEHEHEHGCYCGVIEEAEPAKLVQPDLPGEYIVPLAGIFKVLGDPTRLRILHALMAGEMCVCEISDAIQMGQSAVSHQLRILRDARLVQYRRDGKVIWYSLSDDHVFMLLTLGLEHVAE